VRADGAIAAAMRGAGALVPPGDGAALAEAIRTLAAEPARRAELGAAARLLAKRDWDRDGILERFEAALLESINIQ
jgi:colanic acid biosynthesis glycosyl transferase WcaI